MELLSKKCFGKRIVIWCYIGMLIDVSLNGDKVMVGIHVERVMALSMEEFLTCTSHILQHPDERGHCSWIVAGLFNSIRFINGSQY